MNVPNNRIAAWTAPNGVCWPKDLLPRDIPTARIMAFGYNSNVAFSKSLVGLGSHGQDLLYWLDRRRPVEVNYKGILWLTLDFLTGIKCYRTEATDARSSSSPIVWEA